MSFFTGANCNLNDLITKKLTLTLPIKLHDPLAAGSGSGTELRFVATVTTGGRVKFVPAV